MQKLSNKRMTNFELKNQEDPQAGALKEQMWHTPAQIVYRAYKKLISKNNNNPMNMPNAGFTTNAPYMPRAVPQ